jgi:ABC-type transport system involved in cytochrome c biogenesis permease component
MALLPCDRGWIFLGKAAANLAILSVVQIAIVAVFALFFELEL